MNPVFWRFESAPDITSFTDTDYVVVQLASGLVGRQTVRQLAAAMALGAEYEAAVAALTLSGA